MGRIPHVALIAVALGATGQLWGVPSDFANSYALVIGIDQYSAPWRKLDHARSDAEGVAQQLRRLGFDVRTLYDKQAGKRDILERGFADLATKVQAEDRVLVFFAGHGYTTTDYNGDHGFIVPWAGTEDPASLISMEDLTAAAASLKLARHELFIMDSCYSGMLARETPMPPGNTSIAQRAQGHARQIITAGTKGQEVVDEGTAQHSLFTGTLLDGLRGRADLNGDGYVTVSELMDFLQVCASTLLQTPRLGYFSGQDGGDFFFEMGLGAEPAGESAYLRACLQRGTPRTVQPCDVNNDGVVNVLDVQLLINQTLGTVPCKNDLTGLNKCTVVDVRRLIDNVLGKNCHVGR
jgi:hypothetical protein